MTNWLDRLTPDDYVSSVYDLDLDKLWAAGKRLILTDLDNTLVPWNAPDAPGPLLDWMRTASRLGFDVCIVSNNEGARVDSFSKRAGVDAIGKARKPRPDVFRTVMRRYGRAPHETIMLGDQLFTDIQGAKRAGVHSILVLPINEQEWWVTRLVRRMERLVMWQLIRSGRLVKPSRHPESHQSRT